MLKFENIEAMRAEIARVDAAAKAAALERYTEVQARRLVAAATAATAAAEAATLQAEEAAAAAAAGIAKPATAGRSRGRGRDTDGYRLRTAARDAAATLGRWPTPAERRAIGERLGTSPKNDQEMAQGYCTKMAAYDTAL